MLNCAYSWQYAHMFKGLKLAYLCSIHWCAAWHWTALNHTIINCKYGIERRYELWECGHFFMHSTTLPPVSYRDLAAPTLTKVQRGWAFSRAGRLTPAHFFNCFLNAAITPCQLQQNAKYLAPIMDNCIQMLHVGNVKLHVAINGRAG